LVIGLESLFCDESTSTKNGKNFGDEWFMVEVFIPWCLLSVSKKNGIAKSRVQFLN